MLAEFQDHINNYFPELKSGKSLLAISGGMDSMVLLDLMKKSECDFSMAHCNFQLRGKEADKDEALVKRVGLELGKKVYSKKFDTKAYAQDRNVSIQMAARELRYDWFRELMEKLGIIYLVTAHHADDNLETFLINLSRGSGLNGLTGIPEKTSHILRPMLVFSREQIHAHAIQNDISWREDESNKETRYLRNAIRAEVIPALKKISPNFLDSFGQTLSHLKESRQLVIDRIDAVSNEVIASDKTIQGLTKYRLDKIKELSNPKAYLFHLFAPYGFTQWEDIYGLLSGQSGKMVYSDSHRMVRDREYLLLEPLSALKEAGPALEIKTLAGEFDLPGGTVRLRLEEIELEKTSQQLPSACRSVAYFDSDLLRFPLTVRKWKNGDYFYPSGMEGRKKLSKFFKDEKLSIPEKENIWLLCAGNEIAWVIGHRTDRRFCPNPKSLKVLKIEIEKLL